jgi:GT2 family glycosyltransferase
MSIGIVVGTYNRFEHIKRCVESVLRETRTPFRLYVTDAGSTDGTIEYLESVASEQVVPIFVGKRIGQARAYNDAFRAAPEDYIAWISDDNEIVNGGIDKAAAILDEDPRLGMVALKVKDLQGPFVDAPYIGGMSTLGILNVNQGMLRREVLSQVGYFGEAFRDYGIDPDLTAKVLLSGWDIAYTRDVAIHHYRLWEMDKTKPEYASLEARQARARELYTQKYRSALGPAPLWLAKKAMWVGIRKLLGKRYSINGKTPFLGRLPRDWSHAMSGRYISILDSQWEPDSASHLRQRAPSRRPTTLPPDPVPEAAQTLAPAGPGGGK